MDTGAGRVAVYAETAVLGVVPVDTSEVSDSDVTDVPDEVTVTASVVGGLVPVSGLGTLTGTSIRSGTDLFTSIA